MSTLDQKEALMSKLPTPLLCRLRSALSLLAACALVCPTALSAEPGGAPQGGDAARPPAEPGGAEGIAHVSEEGGAKPTRPEPPQHTASTTLKYPQPTDEEVAHEPPLLEDLLALTPIKVDQERCRAQAGRWKTLEGRLHGCVLRSAKEGRWHLQAKGEPISLLAHFTKDQLDGPYLEFNSSGRGRRRGLFRAGQKEGRWLSWHEGGQLESVTHYQGGRQHGRHFSWFDSCLPQEWGAFVEGERQGPWRTWYMTGARQEEGRYEDGKQEGLWRFYHSEGNKIEEGELKGGLKQGAWQEWLHTGQPWRSVTYLDGERQGEDQAACRAAEGAWEVDYKERLERCVWSEMTIIAELQYYPSGALRRRLPYHEGQHSGLDQRFHESGELLAEGRYVRGVPQGTHRYLSPSGEQFASVQIEDGSGLWVSYHPNGAIEEVGRYQGGLKVGVWRTFHDHVQGQREPITDPEQALVVKQPAGLKEELIFSNEGLLNGPYLSLYEDGTLSVKGSFTSGSRSGTWQFNYQNGQPAVEGDFDFGVRMGAWREWYWMASPKMDGAFQFNRKDGLWREYHNNGKLKAEGQYKRGQKEGPWRLYWYSGEPWRELKYTGGIAEDEEASACERLSGQWTEDLKGRSAGCRVCRVTAEGTPKLLKLGKWRWWHPNGRLQTEGHFESGERHGAWRQFDEAERRILEGQYAHDQQVKQWRGYYPSGALKFRGAYRPEVSPKAQGEQPAPQEEHRDALKGGHEDGVWYTFSPSGALESVGRYDDGARTGLWAWWGEGGALSQVGAYQAGAREGVWVSWHSSGSPRDIGAYRRGERHGPWRWWHEDGAPWRAQWYGPKKQRASLPAPASLQEPPPFEALKHQLEARFKALSASQLSEETEPIELKEPLSLPPLSAPISASLQALGLSLDPSPTLSPSPTPETSSGLP